jgi:hypothetical protein
MGNFGLRATNIFKEFFGLPKTNPWPLERNLTLPIENAKKSLIINF